MVRIVRRLCFLCYQDGKYTPATHYYIPSEFRGGTDTYDICDEHKELVQNQNVAYRIPEDERVEEM